MTLYEACNLDEIIAFGFIDKLNQFILSWFFSNKDIAFGFDDKLIQFNLS
jgi:hypothetical protein